MPRQRTRPETLTPGQLAKRWGVSVDRFRGLLECGEITGAFRIPSAGRYGEAIKIPLASVLEVEKRWAIGSPDVPSAPKKPRRRLGSSPPRLKHFPELFR